MRFFAAVMSQLRIREDFPELHLEGICRCDKDLKAGEIKSSRLVSMTKSWNWQFWISIQGQLRREIRDETQSLFNFVKLPQIN